jgi:hypothetical protein
MSGFLSLIAVPTAALAVAAPISNPARITDGDTHSVSGETRWLGKAVMLVATGPPSPAH